MQLEHDYWIRKIRPSIFYRALPPFKTLAQLRDIEIWKKDWGSEPRTLQTIMMEEAFETLQWRRRFQRCGLEHWRTLDTRPDAP